MNNKTIIFIVSIIVLVLGGIGYSLWNSNPLVDNQTQEQENQEEDVEVKEVKLVTLVKDKFEIDHPESWVKLTPPAGIQVLLNSVREEPIDSEKEKDGFKTYLAITYDTLQGKTREEFISYVKNILTDSLPFITFEKEEIITIDEREATVLEAIIIQEEYTFNSLLVIISGEGDDMWTLSFNTSEIRWEDSKDLFYKITNSFKLK